MKCITCSTNKPDEEFLKIRGSGLTNRCFDCRKRMAVINKAFHERNPDYRFTNPQPYDPVAAAKAARERKYGLKDADYQRMLTDQENFCAICRQERKLVVDHCHTSGQVRQLLCHSCNTGIGHLREDITVLESAIEYIRRHTVGCDK